MALEADLTGVFNGEGLSEDTEKIALPADATGAYVRPVVHWGEFAKRCRHAWGSLPGVEDALEGIAVDHPETVPAAELRAKFEKALQNNAKIQSVIGDARWYFEKQLPLLLSPDWEDQNLLFGDGLRGQRIGRGSFGEVYEGVFRGIEVVGKVFNPLKNLGLTSAQIAQARERFLEEAAVLKLIGGDGAPAVLAEGEYTPGHPFFLMQRIHGWSLQEILQQAACKPLPKQLATDLSVLLLAVVGQVHRNKNIVHRDLKPGNIMLDVEGVSWLIDFGLVHDESDDGTRLTGTNQVLGTPTYMAPEQVSNPRGVRKKADVYALGAMAHEFFTGKTPYTGESPQDIVHKLLDPHTHPDYSAYEDDADLKELMMQWLQKDPAVRLGIDNVAAVLFPRSSFAKQYGTWANFSHTAHRKRQLLQMPNVSSLDSLSIQQQGGRSVPTADAAYTFFLKKFAGSLAETGSRRPRLGSWPVKVGIGLIAVVTAGGVVEIFRRSTGSDERPEAVPTRAAAKATAPTDLGTSPFTTESTEVQKLRPFEFVKDHTGAMGIVFFPEAPSEVQRNGDPARVVFSPEEGVHFWEGEGSNRQWRGRMDIVFPTHFAALHGSKTLTSFHKKPALMHTFRGSLQGKEVLAIFISGMGMFISTDQGMTAYTHPAAKFSPLPLNCDRHVGPQDVAIDPVYLPFFQSLDLEHIQPELRDMSNWAGGEWGMEAGDGIALKRRFINTAVTYRKPPKVSSPKTGGQK